MRLASLTSHAAALVLLVAVACEGTPPEAPGPTPTPTRTPGGIDAACIGEPSEVAALATRGEGVAGGDLWVLCTDGSTGAIPEEGDDAVEYHAVDFEPDGRSAVFERRDGQGSVIVEVDLVEGHVTELGEGELPARGPDGTLAWAENIAGGEAPLRVFVGEDLDAPEVTVEVDDPSPPEFVPAIDELLWTPDGDLIYVSRWARGQWGIPLSEGTEAPIRAGEEEEDIFYASFAPDDQGRLATVRFMGAEPPVRVTLGTVAYDLDADRFLLGDFRAVADLTALPDGGVGEDPSGLVVSAGHGLDVESTDGDSWQWAAAEQDTWFVSDGFRSWVVRADGSAELLSSEIGPVWVNPGAGD